MKIQKIKITKTVTKSVTITKVIDVNTFPLTETSNFNRTFILSNRVDSIRIKTAKRNPKAKRIYFISLFQEDLENLFDIDSKKEITEKDIKHNEFAVYNYQLK